jgi:RimJ/RimL family protein N-acetyltransferase
MQERLFHLNTALLTPRTIIRRFREDDGEAVYQLVYPNLSWLADFGSPWNASIHTLADAQGYVRIQLAGWLKQEAYGFGVWDKDQARLIGLLHLDRIDWQLPKAELAFFVAPEFSRKGFMTEVLFKVIAFAFEELGLEKIKLSLDVDNYAGQRLARKCGFRREGDLRMERRKPGGELVDMLLMAAYATDFVALEN